MSENLACQLSSILMSWLWSVYLSLNNKQSDKIKKTKKNYSTKYFLGQNLPASIMQYVRKKFACKHWQIVLAHTIKFDQPNYRYVNVSLKDGYED
jgi:hypothetical protein